MLSKLIQLLNSDTFPVALPGHFIDGTWGVSKATANSMQSLCPSTGTLLASSSAHKSDVKAAIDCAFAYHLAHHSEDFDQRIARIKVFAGIFRECSRDIKKIAIREQGKPLWEIEHELNATTEYLDWVAENGDFIKDQLLGPARLGHLTSQFIQKPAGVTAAYLPFSTTISTFGFYYVATTLSNCPMIMFSSSHNLLQGALFAAIAEQASLSTNQERTTSGSPPLSSGAFQMIFAGFSEFKLSLADRRVSAVMYTGSRDHCDEIRADSGSFPERRLILQSGGKNTALVHSSANMKLAVNSILLGAFRSAGQLCSSTNRVVVHHSRLEEFSQSIKEAMKKITIGPTHLETFNPFMGPLYSDKAVERFLRYQTMAAREASSTLAWGRSFKPTKSGQDGHDISGREAPTEGNFVTPGIHLMESLEDTSYQKSVIFCPDIAVYHYDELESGIRDIVNQTHASFSVSFFGDKSILEPRIHLFEAPNILHDLPTTEVEACLPLAGRYASGFHRYHGPSLAHYLLHPCAYQTREQVCEKLKTWPEIL